MNIQGSINIGYCWTLPVNFKVCVEKEHKPDYVYFSGLFNFFIPFQIEFIEQF